jgi:hypothetical protein
MLKIELNALMTIFLVEKNKCTLEHVMRWLNLFIDMHNEMILQRRVK